MARILVVDGNRDTLDAIAEALSHESGYEVTLALAADEALSLIAKQRFDMICIDTHLSGEKDGLTLAHELQPQVSAKILLTTAGRCPKSEFLCLQKPFDLATFLLTIEMLLHASANPQ